MTLADRYVLKHELGHGGMATVYLAHDPTLGLDVALKVLPDELAADVAFRHRFRREGQTLAQLSHPNILRLFDIGEDVRNGVYFLVLEYLTGGTLKDRLSGQPWTVSESVRLLRDVGGALDYAHHRERAIIHRDIKPSNIMFNERARAVVSDFGVARLLAPDEGNGRESSPPTLLTLSGGQIFGTPAYMAPEQADGRTTGPAADLYALGVLAYEMLVGRVPHQADTPLGTLLLVVSEPVPLPRDINPAIDPGVEQVLLKALSRNPADRHVSAAAFVEALDTAHAQAANRTQESPRALSVAVADLTQTRGAQAIAAPPPRKWRGVIASALLLLVVVGGLMAYLTRDLNPTGPLPAQTPIAAAVVVPERVITALPTGTPVPVLAPSPTPLLVATAVALTVTPASGAEWQLALGRLDATWDKDWPQAIQILKQFLQRFPDHAPAREKLHAALLLHMRALVTAGQTQAAIQQLVLVPAYSPARRYTDPPPTPDDIWNAAQGELNELASTDSSKTLDFLDAFLEQFPDYEPAKDSLYTALLVRAEELYSEGNFDEGDALLRRADDLYPGRDDLPKPVRPTPTPIPIPAAPRPPVNRPAIQPPVPAPPPTKVPCPRGTC